MQLGVRGQGVVRGPYPLKTIIPNFDRTFKLLVLNQALKCDFRASRGV